uniref:ABC transporter permease n=1 Tax=Fulvivirga sp. TaxID=1931237 RepID=UPI00404A4757
MKDIYPPKLAHKLLAWLIKDELAEEVSGDLDEKFYTTINKTTITRAKLNYWYQVLNYFRPFALKNYRSNLINNNMQGHYFKIGYRNLSKNKGYSFINIGGLAIGMTVAILIGMWVYDELSFNKYHDNNDRIGQVMFNAPYDGEIETNNIVPTGLGTYIKDTYPNKFDKVVMIRSRLEERLFSYTDDHYIANGYYTQPEGPEMLGLEMVAGTYDALNKLTTVILSESLADKMFGDKDPIGEIVRFNEQVDLEVMGIYKDLPKNSTFSEAKYLAPLDIFLYGWSSLNVWDNQNMHLFLQLKDGVSWAEASSLIKDVYNPHLEQSTRDVFVHPMSEWHLNSNFENGQLETSDRVIIIWFYSAIGFAVLLLACVNFMNLSTSRSENRAKEIGLRKTMGSARIQLVYQFLSESTLVSILSFIISLGLVSLTLPWFNEIAGKDMNIPWGEPAFWLFGTGFTLFTGIFAGSYPALFLSGFNPVKSLKGSFKTGKYSTLPRKVLVVFQFTVSITLIIGTVIIYQQIQFVKERPVGYLRDGLLMMPKRSSELYGKYDVLRNELKKTGYVEEIGEANYPLTNTLGNNGGFSWEGSDPNANISFNTIQVNHEYGKTVGWEVTDGRDFSRDNKSDNTAVVITESAREKMGLKNPIGKTLYCSHDYWGSPQFTIIGVVNDMIKGDPFESSSPGIMFLREKEMEWQFIRMKEGVKQGEAVTKIEEVYRELVPEAFTDFKVMHDEYATKFKAEEQTGELAAFLSTLAILISCLGLFGLAAFMTEKRAKEIGIRKVLGASINSIWQLLTKDFVALVVLSSLIAAPIAYYGLDNWISKYDYRMEISLWVFVWASIGALVITLITVSYQAIKSAITNPVDTLRAE